jgi:hypothetical protein
MGCDEGMGLGMGQREKTRKDAKSVLEVSERRMLWWKCRRYGSAWSKL